MPKNTPSPTRQRPLPRAASYVVYGPTPRHTATGHPVVQRTARRKPAYRAPQPAPLSATGQRVLLPGQPGAVPGAYAPNVAAAPRWHGSHWATGLGNAVRTRKVRPQPSKLTAQQVAARAKYGY